MSGREARGLETDAVVIGGGFYGACIANYLVNQRALKKVHLFEREPELFSRASKNNQARVHNGYHYPRSFKTAFRSRVNFPLFAKDWSQAIRSDFTKVYAIARQGSKVRAGQFQRFYEKIGAVIQEAPREIKTLFDSRLIENVFVVEEYAFDYTKLAKIIEQNLIHNKIGLHLAATVTRIERRGDRLGVGIQDNNGNCTEVTARLVFNCTYSGINQIQTVRPSVSSKVKHEFTEIALMEVPSPMKSLGITVMDGPFFSIMPFPAKECHTFSHVRYTPHFEWMDTIGNNPYRFLKKTDLVSRYDRMRRDISRYLPVAREATYLESLFEIKTILLQNEGDDGRPIFFEQNDELPGCFSILGGKIDNIYDVFERLDQERF